MPVTPVKFEPAKNAKSEKTESVKNVAKKKQNRNGKLGINKDSNYAYVPNAPRKTCQNYFSTNHLTHACKKSVGSVPKTFYDCFVPLRHKYAPFCDKFDCMSCNMNVMTSCFNLRRQFIGGCISHNLHTHYTRSKSSSPPKARKVPLLPKSEKSNSKTSNSDKKTSLKKNEKHVVFDKTISRPGGPKLVWVPKKSNAFVFAGQRKGKESHFGVGQWMLKPHDW